MATRPYRIDPTGGAGGEPVAIIDPDTYGERVVANVRELDERIRNLDALGISTVVERAARGDLDRLLAESFAAAHRNLGTEG